MRRAILIIIGLFFLSFTLSLLYNKTVITYPRKEFKKYVKVAEISDNNARVNFSLHQDAYLLKIKHIIKKSQFKEIYINGILKEPDVYHLIRKRGIVETDYIYLPKNIIKEGNNIIEILFLKNHPPSVSIILSNYRKKIGNGIYVLFSDSEYLYLDKISFKTTVAIIVITCLSLSGIIYFLSKILSLNINKLFLYQIYSLMPFLFFLIILGIDSNLSKLYKIAITPGYFWTFGVVSFFLTESGIVLRKLLQGHRRKEENIKRIEEIRVGVIEDIKNIGDINNAEEIRVKGRVIINPKVKELTCKAIEWIELREFADKCVLLFMNLLIVCAFLLILDLEPVAEQLSNLAYFALVTGVTIKFIKFIRGEKT